MASYEAFEELERTTAGVTYTCPRWCFTDHGVHLGEEDWNHTSQAVRLADRPPSTTAGTHGSLPLGSKRRYAGPTDPARGSQGILVRMRGTGGRRADRKPPRYFLDLAGLHRRDRHGAAQRLDLGLLIHHSTIAFLDGVGDGPQTRVTSPHQCRSRSVHHAS